MLFRCFPMNNAMDGSTVENLTQLVDAASNQLYQPYALPVILLAVGGWLTLKTGLIQIRRFGAAFIFVTQGSFRDDSETEGTITSFQALSTALASTVGNGNIGGVATAILVGGPGAIFWMWICAAVGMATKYSEAILGVHFRVRTERGELASGPMYYISNGLPWKRVAKLLSYMFCFFGAATALLGTGNMAQSNTIARTFVESARLILGVSLPHWMPGILITLLVGLVLLGGIRRIAGVAGKLVPSMLVLYLLTGLTFVVLNYEQLPQVFALIFKHAFSPAAALGGFVGAGVSTAIAAGISRGVLSNEAGMGSAPIAHGIAKVDHPVQQGLVGVFEVFMDTIVVCSMTAFMILSSGMWTDATYQNASGDLTAAALSTSIPYASLIVALASFLFGFSTLIGWCYYGEKCFEYMFGTKTVVPYRVLFTALIMVGSVVSVPLVWALGTLLNGLMAIPNLVGLLFLSGLVARLTREYFED
jgi:AGCS family alanine or glycine:cation symporter